MVEERLTDGRRIAQLLASEVTGHGDALATVSVTDADPTVLVQPDRIRVEFERAVDVAADAASDAGLRVRPKAVEPPRTLVFVENGAQVKWLVSTLRAIVSA
jgi:hypothetical protein